MATRKKWIPIVVGIVIFALVVGVGLVAGLVYFVTRQVRVQTTSVATSRQEFDHAVAGLAGQKPFIEVPDTGGLEHAVVHRELETRAPGSVSTLHVRVWMPDERKLVRVDLPFWILRLTGNKPLTIHGGDSFEGVTLTVTPEEIERRGPGLLLDRTNRDGERVLVWTE